MKYRIFSGIIIYSINFWDLFWTSIKCKRNLGWLIFSRHILVQNAWIYKSLILKLKVINSVIDNRPNETSKVCISTVIKFHSSNAIKFVTKNLWTTTTNNPTFWALELIIPSTEISNNLTTEKHIIIGGLVLSLRVCCLSLTWATCREGLKLNGMITISYAGRCKQIRRNNTCKVYITLHKYIPCTIYFI